MNRDLFLVTNNIDKNIEMLNKTMLSLSVKLEDEKKLNKEMIKLVSNLENTQNGSEVLINDSKTKYNIQYYKNSEIFIGILIISIVLSGLFKNKL
jgi:hypothetical protein